MSAAFDPNAWARMIIKGMGLSPTGRTPAQPKLHTASFSITSKKNLDQAKARIDKPIPFSGFAGYSEKGAPEDWDMAMGEVFGYRWWYLVVPPEMVGYLGYVAKPSAVRQTYILYGANNQSWMDGRMEAVCTKTNTKLFSGIMDRSTFTHKPPETREACGCGFWAYFNEGMRVDEVLAMKFADNTPSIFSYGAAIPVFGVVKGTGRVIIGEKGFRSQYAEIIGLCIPPVSVRQLGWWLTPGDGSFGQVYEPGWSDAFPSHRQECTPAEHEVRLASVETVIAQNYPSAKLFTDQKLLTQYFPPDKNYS